MSAPHPRAVGSLGAEIEAWVKEELGLTMRWWQRLAIRRQYEVDAEGNLLWATVIESTPRRAGKSTRIRATSLWRLHQSERFGEQQLILLTGKDLPIIREIIRRSWPWAQPRGYETRKANGQEEVEHPDGSRWIVRSAFGVYGYDVGYGVVDEAWGVAVSVVDDGLEPALLERKQPQLLLTSTSHRKATPLMRVRRAAALSQLTDPTDVLLLHWGASPNATIDDREAWRLASPHWSPEREAMLERTLTRLLSGEEIDPDEPDPAESFRCQYLNIFIDNRPPPKVEPGEPVVLEERWVSIHAPEPADIAWHGVAVEAWFGSPPVVALAGRLPSGKVLVSVVQCESVAEAAGVVSRVGLQAAVGKSLLHDPVWSSLAVEPRGATTAAALTEFRTLIDDEVLLHDGGELLTRQALEARVTTSATGTKAVSQGRTDAVKAATWAVSRARGNAWFAL